MSTYTKFCEQPAHSPAAQHPAETITGTAAN
jgi:hypothetical protein